MNVLIRFEDSYGCKTLFEYSKSILKSCSDIEGSFGNTGVFDVSERDIDNNDYIVIVFDMDEPNNYSLTSKDLKKLISENELDKHADKIILIPVFFCFETLYLFSKQLQNTIDNINTYGNSQSARLIKLYKQYYDYSKINPEVLDNIVNNMSSIQSGVESITGRIASNAWLPQKFHLSYAKQLLKLTYKNVAASVKKDAIFEKHEEKLFKELINKEPSFDINDIFDGINSMSVNNYWFSRLLNMQSLDELEDLILDKNMDKIYDTLDKYNKRVCGVSNRSIAECTSNIESILQFSGIKNIESIKKACKDNGYTDEEITCALSSLGIK